MKPIKSLATIAYATLCLSCAPEWLDEKRDISLTVPTTLKDMRALLNNGVFQFDYIGMGETSVDDYYLLPAVWEARSERERNLYIWQDPIYPDALPIAEWNDTYRQVFYSNVALEGLAKITPSPSEYAQWQQLKGEALYYRAKAFYNLAQLFAKPYDAATAATDPGIPLRLTADVNAPTSRASLQAVYEQIIGDYQTAVSWLPVHVPERTHHPKKAAGYAALARCHLAMRRYEQALLYADSALQLHATLLDYNQLNPELTYPVPPYNEEVIAHNILSPLYNNFSGSTGLIDTFLYASYAENDLRRTVFARLNADGTYGFKGSYNGSLQLFSGLTTAEMLLIRAECLARAGNHIEALADLNRLLEKRYRGEFIPITSDAAHILDLVLQERRKELTRRGLRWVDLRRLNTETGQQTTLRRTLNGREYTLPPNDPRYVLPIPDYVIQQTGIPQNARH